MMSVILRQAPIFSVSLASARTPFFQWNRRTRHRRCRIGNIHQVGQRHRRTIVTQISPTASLLRADESDNEVYLIGTAHISEASAGEVKEMIRLVQPHSVFVELDAGRAARLRAAPRDGEDEAFERAVREMLSSLGGGGGDALGASFRGFYGLLKKWGYIPGVDMKAAMDEAERARAVLVYGDRDVGDTLRELRAAMNPASLISAMRTPAPPELERVLRDAIGGGYASGGLADGVETLKTREHAALMTRWLDEALPEIADVMIHRRDRAMAMNLRLNCGVGKVVAVVGLAHVDGITRTWQDLAPSLLPS